MISIQIEDKNLEALLIKHFDTPQKINDYLRNLIEDDLTDKKFAKVLLASHKKDYVKKDEVFALLDKKI